MSIIKQQADGRDATPLLQKSQWSHFASVNSCQIFPFFFPASSVGAEGHSLPVALLQMMQFDRNHMKSLVLGHRVARGLERGGSTQQSCTHSVSYISSAPFSWLVPNVHCLSKAALLVHSTNQKTIITPKRTKLFLLVGQVCSSHAVFRSLWGLHCNLSYIDRNFSFSHSSQLFCQGQTFNITNALNTQAQKMILIELLPLTSYIINTAQLCTVLYIFLEHFRTRIST